MWLFLLQFIWLHSLSGFLEHVCFISLLCLLNQQPGSRHCFLFMTSCVFHVSETGKQLRAAECWHTAIAQQGHFWCGGNWLFRAVGERQCKYHWCSVGFLLVGHLLASADTIKAAESQSHLPEKNWQLLPPSTAAPELGLSSEVHQGNAGQPPYAHQTTCVTLRVFYLVGRCWDSWRIKAKEHKTYIPT